MGTLILNCDLGENEAFEQTEQLISLIDAANVSCGFHAGSLEMTRRTLQCAAARGILIGAHPGLVDGGGRGNSLPTVDAFTKLLEIQIGKFLDLTEEVGAKPNYVKLHGTLYHAVDIAPELADAYVRFMSNLQPKLGVMAFAGGQCARLAESRGLVVYHEAFADRRYQSDGTLVPRSEKDAVLSRPSALENIQNWLQSGKMPTRKGSVPVAIAAGSLCVHGDSPDAAEMISELRQVLKSLEEGA